MGLWDEIKKRYRTAPVKDPVASATVTSNQMGDRGRVGKEHAPRYRAWAERSEWIRAAINVRKSQISQSDWEVVKFDSEGSEPNQAMMTALKQRFNQPNPAADSWRSFIEPIVEDILVLDAGVIEKERTLGGEVIGLWPVDGAKIKVNTYWAGDPDDPRYYYYNQPLDTPVSFLNEDMIYIMESPSTYRKVGLSKLETLQMAIESELSGHMYNHRQVTNAAPDGMLDLGQGARPEQVNSFKRYWDAEVAGKGAMAFIGGTKDAKFIPFRGDNREMQFMEWQMYLVRKICAVFGLSPQDIAVTNDINRATADIQAEQTEDRGLRPLLGLIQEYLTREVVWDPTFGGPQNNLAFRFTRLNLKESLTRAQINERALARISWKTPNEARRQDGLPPLEGDQYDSLIALSSIGPVSLSDVPTAREVMEAKKPAPKPPAGPPAASQKDMDDLRIEVKTIDRKLLEAPRSDPLTSVVAQQQSVIRDLAAMERQITFDVHPTPAPNVEVHPANIEVKSPDVTVHPATIEIHPPNVVVNTPDVTIEKGAVQVDVKAPSTRRRIQRDAEGRIEAVVEDEEG